MAGFGLARALDYDKDRPDFVYGNLHGTVTLRSEQPALNVKRYSRKAAQYLTSFPPGSQPTS